MLLTCVYHILSFYLCLFVIWCLKMFEMCWSSWKVKNCRWVIWVSFLTWHHGGSTRTKRAPPWKVLGPWVALGQGTEENGETPGVCQIIKTVQSFNLSKKKYKPVTTTRLCSMKGWILGTKESIWSHLAGSCSRIKNIAQFPGPVGRASHLFVHARISPINKM